MRNSEFELQDLFFPVELRPVFFETKLSNRNESGSGNGRVGAASVNGSRRMERRQGTEQSELFHDYAASADQPEPDDEADTDIARIPRYQAVVDCEEEYVFKVVSDSYQLITNREAVDIGERAYAKLFPAIEDHTGGFKPLSVIAPKTRAHCHIDLVHETFDMEVWEQEVYKPYLRVTNSYNSTHALKYRLGFVRMACRNGIIFDEEVVNVNLPHTKSHLGEENVSEVVELEADVERLRQLEREFIAHLKDLRDVKVPKLYASPLAAHALEMNFDVDADDKVKRGREREKARDFDREIQSLVDRYYQELGPNAYAMFNVITDYASNREDASQRLRINTYQRRAGNWLRDFAEQYSDPHFGLDQYVESELETFEGI